MPQITANGIQLEYETAGDPTAPPVLLIMGLGAQLTRWPESFWRGLVEAGYYVIRYDNRDIGLSQKLSDSKPVRLGRVALRALIGLPGQPPYTLDDMALDAVGLLDALQIRSAHVIGVSMGGMLGQLVAARHPDRVRSFVCIMSSSGSRTLPPPRISLQLQLLKRVPSDDREARIRHTMNVLRSIGSATYPRDEAVLRADVTRDLDRNSYIPGFARQLTAILSSPSRLGLLPTIKTATLVLHGADDPLVPVAAAYDLHRRIPGAQLEVVPGMGHEIPPAIMPRIVKRILAHLQSVKPAAAGIGLQDLVS